MAVSYKMFLVVIGLTSLMILRFTSVEAQRQCKTTLRGTEYRGSLSQTINGRTCQHWASQTPHSHKYISRKYYPDGNKEKAKNYCRNPDIMGGGADDIEGPWCYTTDPNVRWEYCDVEPCVQCKKTQNGKKYIGSLSKTVSGRTCQAWASQSPHEHIWYMFTQGNAQSNRNHCRNPRDGRNGNKAAGPWCYTTDPAVRWEFCDVKLCGT